MTLYICTVGTSIAGRPQAGASLQQRIDDNLAAKRAAHGDDPRGFLIDATAETNVLARRDCGPADEVLLLVTDTADGTACGARLAALIAEELGAKVRVEAIAGLQVADEAAFRERGLRNLVRKARAAARDGRGRGHAVAFNITGGFKGVVPYLTLLGMFERADILYVYQEIDALIRLPALPLRFDAEAIAPALPTLQALRDEIMDDARFDEIARRGGWAGDPTIALLFERDGGQVAVSAAGELALEAPSPRRRSGRLFVHRRARGELANHLVRQDLPGLNDAALRSIPHHGERQSDRTDLLIWKTYGASAPRLFYWLDGEDVYLADILRHDRYLGDFRRGNLRLWRKDYPAGQFEEETSAEDSGADPYPAALAEFVATVDEERVRLAARVSELEGELKDARRRAEREAKGRETASEALDALTAPLPATAAAFAAMAHGAQKRKDGVTPYFEHLRAVARILAVEAGVTDPELMAAGFLHDCIEDQQVPGDCLETCFGARVRALVEAVSDDKSLDKETRKRLQIERAAATAPDAVLLKFADKIANLRDLVAAPPVAWPIERRIGYLDWAEKVAAGLRGRGTSAHQRLEAAFDAAMAAAREALG